MGKLFRCFSGLMLVGAMAFLSYALTHPECGSVFYVFGVPIGSEIWRVFYVVYALVMIGLFIVSFFIRKKDK